MRLISQAVALPPFLRQAMRKMKTVSEIVEFVRRDAREGDRLSIFLEATKVPKPILDAGGPPDLIEFYTLCSGFSYRPTDAYRYVIVRPDEFVRGDYSDQLSHALCRKPLQENGVAKDLYIIAIQGGSGDETIVIDLSEKNRGLCYEAYPDKFGTPQSMVYAKTFTELLNVLVLRAEEFEQKHMSYGFFGDEELLAEPVDTEVLWKTRWRTLPKEWEYEAFWADLKRRQGKA